MKTRSDLNIRKEIIFLEKDLEVCNNCSHLNDPCCSTSTVLFKTKQTNDIDLFFVGQGAGRKEDINMTKSNKFREPFVGPAGSYLRNMIYFLWTSDFLEYNSRFNIALSNNVRFHPLNNGKDRPPTKKEIEKCKLYLYRDILKFRPKVIVALGKSASLTFLPKSYENRSISSLRSKVRTTTINSYTNVFSLICTYHPSFLLRQYRKFDKSNLKLYDEKLLHDIKIALKNF